MRRTLQILMFTMAFTVSGPLMVKGQDVEFTASAKNNVQVGEQFRVSYSVNTQPSSFSGPAFEGFRVLSGPNQSSNQSFQIINGKVTQSVSITYTYFLKALKEGTYDIEAAAVTVGGKKYESNPLQITVSKATTPSTGQPGTPPSSGQEGSAQGISGDDVFIKAYVDKKSPYQGEQVIITYRIYTQVPISQISIDKQSSFPGFWYKNLLDDNQPLKQHTENINGKEYVVADLRKIALFPQTSGKITIEPMEMTCTAQIKTARSQRFRDPFFDSFFDDPFFNRNYQNMQLDLESNPVTLDIKPLPSEGRPQGFRGSVGSFTMSSDVDRTELKSNEPLVFKIHITGKGNIELIDAPNVSFPPDFETYDPKITGNINKTAVGISGDRTFEYLVIPRNAGNFEIKPVEFSYFDPEKKQYFTMKTPSYPVTVEKGEVEPSGISYSGVSQKDIQFIGSDIHHIKTHAFDLKPIGLFFVGSLKFYLWILVPLVLFLIILVYARQIIKRRGNAELMRNKRANKVARRNLKKAGEYLREQKSDEFYEEVSRALWGYISQKFSIPLAELSVATVNQRLTVKNISKENIDIFIDVLDQCDYARFAPGEKSKKMQEIYDSALHIISKIERELK